MVTSRLTRLECRSKPLRAGDLATLAQFDVFFAGVELVLADVSPAVIERATDLRAKYNLKTPDAPLRHGRGDRRDGVLDRGPRLRTLHGGAGGGAVSPGAAGRPNPSMGSEVKRENISVRSSLALTWRRNRNQGLERA